jgi:hypothetical protein
MKLITPLLLLTVALNGARAFPNYAGDCIGGRAPVDGSHLLSGFRTGSLRDGGYEVSLDGSTLNPGDLVSFTAGEDHALTVRGRFLGILVRLQADDGVDTSAAIVENSNLLQDAFECVAPIAGISHNSNVGKNGAEITLRLDVPSNVALDITIVLGNGWGESIFYYSGFALASVGPPGGVLPAPPTPTPTPAPVPAPTPVPTPAPVPAPVLSNGVPTMMPVSETTIRTATSSPTTASSAGRVSSLAAYGTALTVAVSIHLLLSGTSFW